MTMRDKIAENVYAAMVWAVDNPTAGKAPEWVDGGNSFAQDEARKQADAIIAALPDTVKDLEWESRPYSTLAKGSGFMYSLESAHGRYSVGVHGPGEKFKVIYRGANKDKAISASNTHHRAKVMDAFK